MFSGGSRGHLEEFLTNILISFRLGYGRAQRARWHGQARRIANRSFKMVNRFIQSSGSDIKHIHTHTSIYHVCTSTLP